MGKKFFQFLLAILFINQTHAQLLKPVKWETSVTASGVPNEYILIFVAAIDEGWKLYSHDVPEDGPIPTSLIFEDLPEGVELIGEMTELGRKDEEVEPLFQNQVIKFYHKKLVLKQTVKISKDVTGKGYIDFMSCDDKQCMAFSHDFSFDLTAIANTYNGNFTTDYSKIKYPVTWEISSEKINDTEYWLKFNATVAPTWKLYSQDSPEDGAQPMKVVFENAGKNYQLIGKADEFGHAENKPEPLFQNKITKFYHDKLEIRQKIKVDSANAIISGYTVSYTHLTLPTSDLV